MPKIAILGAAPSSRLLAPFHDPEWTIWACSPPNYDLPRVDAWFEMHNLDRKMAMPANAPFFDKLARHPRVYLAKKDRRLPLAIEYPKDQVMASYSPGAKYFFTSSIAWMLAFAILQKPEKIGLWGVDMSAADELYTHQRPGCHYWIDEAEKRGINVMAAAQSDILQPPALYGYKEFWPMFWKQKARKQELEERLNQARQLKDKHEKESLIFQGALDDMQYMQTWLQGPGDNPPIKDDDGQGSKTTDLPDAP